MPQLAVPFAIVGAAAGWLSAGLLANPLLAVTLPNKQAISVICAAFVSAVVGAWLTRACAPPAVDVSLPWASAWGDRLRVVFALELAGGVAGAAIGALAAPSAERAVYLAGTGAANGLACAALFTPVALAVVRAAQRSVRARHGSLVAAVDRRMVWAVLAAALGATTLLGLADWPALRSGGEGSPFVALGILGGCCAVIAGVLARDVVAQRRVRAASNHAERMEAVDGAASDESGAQAVDLGLGDGVRAELARADAYRARARAVALVRGDPDAAREAVRRAVGRGACSSVGLAAVFAAHVAAAGPRAERAYDELLCRSGLATSCRAAAFVAAELGDDGASLSHHREACTMNLADSCADAAEAAFWGERDEREADRLRARACGLGRYRSCPGRDGVRYRLWSSVLSSLDPACRGRDLASCVEGARSLAGAYRARGVACAQGSLDDCDQAAQAADSTDAKLAFALRVRACELGRARDCHLAAVAAAQGALTDDEGRMRTAAALYEIACHAGQDVSCCEAAFLRADDRAAWFDRPRAIELYKAAASRGFGYVAACRDLADRGYRP